MQNLAAVSHTMWAYVAGAKSFGEVLGYYGPLET